MGEEWGRYNTQYPTEKKSGFPYLSVAIPTTSSPQIKLLQQPTFYSIICFHPFSSHFLLSLFLSCSTMDFLSNFAKSDGSKTTSDQPNNPDGHGHKKPSNSDLFSSAKMVADAAQCHFRGEPEKYDKGKVAGAAADLLDCASDYGKLDETKGIGKYLDQAEDYLHKYQTTHSTTTTTTNTNIGDSGEQKTTTVTSTATTVTTNPEKDSSGDFIKNMAEGYLNKPSSGGEHGGGAGDYIKMAQGLLHKPSGDGEGGGAGDFMKMAGDFLKK